MTTPRPLSTPAPLVVNQRQHLVLLFTDLSGSTRIAATMEPELYADLLQQLRDLIGVIVPRHGGEIVRVDGDGALCIFGYPEPHEDAGRRATEAALDLHAAAASLSASFASADHQIGMHSGIHAGTVLLRSGDMVRGKYEMLGDATNVAARLCDFAGIDAIIVSEGTLGGDRHLFRTSARRLVKVAGHREDIAVYQIAGRAEFPTRFAARTRQGLTPFAGRENELAAVEQWLDSGSDTALLLHGPAGVGKTRLLGELLGRAAAAGWRTVRGYCEAYLGARPLQPFIQIVAALDPGDDGPNANGADSLVAAIELHHGAGPLLLAIDDWQWADDASRQVLDLVMARLTASDTMRIILVSRDGSAPRTLPAAIRRVALATLSVAESSGVIAALLPQADTVTTSHIHTATGGSPLLIEEMCHIWRSNGALVTDPAARGSWFDLAVQARFAKVSQADAQVLRIASVIGYIVPAWLYSAIAGETIAPAMLERLVAADFLFPSEFSGALRFKHGLTRDAIYAGIDRRERIALHDRVVSALEKRAQPAGQSELVAALAWHSSASGDRIRALDYALRAAEIALAAGALDRARAHCLIAFDQLEPQLVRQASQPTGDVSSLRRVIKAFGRTSVIDPARANDHAFERMRERAERSGDLESTTLANYWMGAHDYGLGEPRRSLARLRTVQTMVDPAQARGFAAQLLANLGQSSAIACRYDDALDFMDEAIVRKGAAAKPGRPEPSLAYCLSSRGLVRADIGSFAAAHVDFDAAIAAMQGYDEPIVASVAAQRALALIYQGRYADAVVGAEFAIERAGRARATYLQQAARVLGEFAAWSHSADEAAFARFAEAALMLHQSERFQRIGFKYGWLAEAMAARGEPAMSRQFVLLALRRALKGDRLGEASALRAMARLAADGACRHGPGHYLRLADRAAAHRRSPREAALNRLCEAQLAIDGDDAAAASRSASAAHRAFAALEMPVHVAHAAALLADASVATSSR